MGDGIKRLTPSEAKNRPVARKSIVASCNIVPGEVFTDRNLIVKRPGTGISPMLWDQVIGQIAKCGFSKDDLIEL
jgi:N,N'-diacetyllegionaminate synthase